MLEFYEVNELEKKWEEYDRNRRKFSFHKFIKNSSLKIDKFIVFSVIFVSFIIALVFWIILKDDNKNKIANNIRVTKQQSVVNLPSDKNIPISDKVINSDTTLKLNDIGIRASEDSAGFNIRNEYHQSNQAQVPQVQNTFNQQQTGLDNSGMFNSIPKDEVIDFGKAPLPPKSGSIAINRDKQDNIVSQTLKSPVFKNQETNIVNNKNLNQQFQFAYQKPRTKEELAGKIVIKEKMKKGGSSIENMPENFSSDDVSTTNINESLSLAQKAYNRGDYDSAIKWSLNSNELDKNNVDSWIIFAKSNYKKGKKDDALFALETFNKKKPTKQVQDIINQMKSGNLR